MAGLFQKDPETGANRPRAPLAQQIQTVLTVGTPPTDGPVPPAADTEPPAVTVDNDLDSSSRAESLGRRQTFLTSADDSPAVLPVADRRRGSEGALPRTTIGIETPRQPQTVSAAGTQFIRDREGFDLKGYPDTAGHGTIGYGHKFRPGEAELFRHGIDKDIAERLLAVDMDEAEAAVHRLVKVPLTQQQHDALVSFTFNFGGRNLAKSTILKELNAGHFQAAADAA